MQGKVEIAGVNTAKLKVLKSSETMELLRRSKAGDRQAREELIEGNLRLVLSVIQRFAGRGESVDDLFQVGCVGLIKAIDNFDISQPVKFSTYGVPMIVGEIRRYLRDNSAIRVSRSMRDTAYRVLQAREHLMAENQKEPTVEEIAKVLDIPREEVVFAMDAIVDPVSLYEPIYDSGGDAICVMDQVSDTKNTDETLDGAHRLEGCHEAAGPTGAAHPVPAVLRGQDPDGGLRRGGHLSGPGEPVGKRGHQHHPQALIGEKPPERCSGGQFCIPPRGCKRNETVFEHFLLFSFDLFCQSV